MTYVKSYSQSDDGTKMNCGCYGVPVNNHSVTYLCPLHSAAPALLEALEAITEFTVNLYAGNGGEYLKEVKAARAAIAQAKGEAGNV